MTWYPYEFDDDSFVIRSEDAADKGRLLRCIGISDRLNGRKLGDVYITFTLLPLDRRDSHDENTDDRGDPTVEVDLELPF